MTPLPKARPSYDVSRKNSFGSPMRSKSDFHHQKSTSLYRSTTRRIKESLRDSTEHPFAADDSQLRCVEPTVMYDQEGNPSEFIVADLQLGSYFGQDALLNRAPDHLEDSVKTFCASNCQFLCIEKCQIE